MAQYVGAPQSFWGDNGDEINSFAHVVTDELGSVNHPERLTVFLDRPNGHKGRMFRGYQPVSADNFGTKEAGDEQLLVARELGMVFTYMNNDEVWESFCDAYNGILTQMTKFDNWMNTERNPHTNAPSNLAAEWPRFVRQELDAVVTLGRTSWQNLYTWKKRAVAWDARWLIMRTVEVPKIKLDRTDKCTNLPATNV